MDIRREYFKKWLEEKGLTDAESEVRVMLWAAFKEGFDTGVNCHANGEWY